MAFLQDTTPLAPWASPQAAIMPPLGLQRLAQLPHRVACTAWACHPPKALSHAL